MQEYQEPITLLSIRKLPDGGYFVGEPNWRPGMEAPQPRFASTTIEDSLKYIKGILEPKPAK